jgi:hypothetical protein
MNRAEDLDVLRDALLLNETDAANAAACLDDDIVAALAEGTLENGRRAKALIHLADCRRCRETVASTARAIAVPAIAREARTPPISGRFVARLVLPLAAAALLLLIVRPPSPTVPPVRREPTFVATASPSPLSPLGTVSAADRLEWSSVTGADRYRVTLFEGGSQVVFEQQVADTMMMLPDSLVLVPGHQYLWKVEARIGRDRWAASGLVDFVVGTGRR